MLLDDPGTPGSSTAVRIVPLAKELKNHGVSWIILAPSKVPKLNPFKKHFFPYNLEETLSLIRNFRKGFDILFISRMSSFPLYLFEKTATMKTVFDLDDPVFLPSRNIFGLKVRSPYFSYLEKIMKGSGAVTTSSHYILSYARKFNPNSFLVHTPMDTREFNPSIRKKSEKLTIGWIGNAYAHLPNLKMLRGPLTELGKHFDIRFKMISHLGNREVKSAFKKVEDHVEVDYGLRNWVPLDKLSKQISDFDIFVSPFTKTNWYEGKSVIKAAIGMAMGIPVVASPVGEQKYVIEHGLNGFIAENEEEWFGYLKTLIENCKLRNYMGIEARKTAEEKLSVEANGKKLYEITKKLALK